MSNAAIFLQRLPKSNPHAHALYPTTHSMIMHYSDKYKDYRKNAKGSKILAEKLGIKNFNKFYTNRKRWDLMRNQIPIYYIEALGISESMVAMAIEIDQEIYDKKIAESVTYEYFTQSYKYFFIKKYSFEEPLSEMDAIEKVRTWITQDGFQFFGTRSPLILSRKPYYDIWFNMDGSHRYEKYRAKYRVRNNNYEFYMQFKVGFRI